MVSCSPTLNCSMLFVMVYSRACYQFSIVGCSCYGVFGGHVTDSQLLDVLCYGVFGRHITDSHLLDALCYGGRGGV
jgi:hypothetical protein